MTWGHSSTTAYEAKSRILKERNCLLQLSDTRTFSICIEINQNKAGYFKGNSGSTNKILASRIHAIILTSTCT